MMSADGHSEMCHCNQRYFVHLHIESVIMMSDALLHAILLSVILVNVAAPKKERPKLASVKLI